MRIGSEELTGNPTATLSSEILLTPACKLMPPVKVNILFSEVPNAEPVIRARNHEIPYAYSR